MYNYNFIYFFILLLALIIYKANSLQITNVIYKPDYNADIIGSDFSNVTSVVVFPFSATGDTTAMDILNKNDTLMTVKFREEQVYQGLLGLFKQTGQTTKYGWNPFILSNISSIPSSGGIITVSGWYITPSTVSNNSITFQNYNLTLTEIGIGGNGTQSYYRMSANQSNFIGTNISVSVLIREIGALSTFSFLSPIISSVNTDSYILQIIGDSFGSDQSKVVVNLNGDAYTQYSKFDKHTSVSINISSIYPKTIKNGKNIVSVNVTNFKPSNEYSFKIYPIILLVTNCSREGGLITISGNYLSLKNVTTAYVKIGQVECKQPTNPNGSNNEITCTMEPLAKGSESSPLPVTITFDTISSNDNGKPSQYFNYDAPTSSSIKLSPRLTFTIFIQLITLIFFIISSF